MSNSEKILIPRKVLFGNPDKLGPQISPDGKKLAFLAPFDNVLNIWAGTLGSEEFTAVTGNTTKGIGNFFWGHDSRQILFLQDVGGDENWHLHSINTETLQSFDYTPYWGIQANPIEHNMHFPNDLILTMNLENKALHDVYHLDISTGFLKLLVKNPGNIVNWKADTGLFIRAAVAASEHGGFDLVIRDNESAGWRVLLSWAIEDTMNISLENFSADNRFLYIRDSRDCNTSRLVKVNIETGETIPVFEDPEYDINFVMTSQINYEAQLISISRERNENFVLDQSIKADVEAVSALNSGDFVIYSRDNTENKWIIGFTRDNAPSSFYLYDRNNKQAEFLFDNRPELNNYPLATMEPFSCQARDGLTLHGYLSFPPGLPGKNLPLVVNVHGGPWSRDIWGFHPEAQWLANRGYICLQVNYRGSTGYGKAFHNAGDKEWGGRMLDDLIDAANWAVEQGFADPGKIAIFGMSYGGYAALAGAAFRPGFFCCAVDICGPGNLVTMIKNIPSYWSALLENFKKRVGDPELESELLISRSPLFKVGEIKIPVLIVQGANDPRIKLSESEAIVGAMQENGIYFEYLVFPDEGHGIFKPENRLKFYGIAEKFLARYLGGNYEEAENLEIISQNRKTTFSIFD
jgi:dipeptidyl aminopeptidase/acylaminoacyl peptidase